MLIRSIACAALLLWPATALADTVDRPPRDCPSTSCPPGTRPYGGGHGSCSPGCSPGPECTPGGGQCAAGDTCEERAYCIEHLALGNSAVDVVHGTCAGGAPCARGECRVSSRCVHPPSPPAPPQTETARSGGLCAASGGARGGPLPGLFLGLGLLWLGRRAT